MDIILYSTGCPKCNVLKNKLTEKNIKYIENNDINLMITLDINQAPMLSIDSKLLNFSEAIKWINSKE